MVLPQFGGHRLDHAVYSELLVVTKLLAASLGIVRASHQSLVSPIEATPRAIVRPENVWAREFVEG